MAGTETSSSNELQAEAFKQLYPEQYYAKFISSNLRPDGRALTVARATTIGINPIGTADSSALVKIGESTAMAGIKLGVCWPPMSTCSHVAASKPHTPPVQWLPKIYLLLSVS